MKLDNIKAIILDVNHTLVGIHSEAEIQSEAVGVLFHEVLRRHPVDISEEAFRSAYGLAWKNAKTYESYQEIIYEDVVRSAWLGFGISFSAAELEAILQIYMEPLYQASYVISGMKDVLAEFRNASYKIAALTNYKYASGMREMLRRLGLTKMLDYIVISSEVGWKKPSDRVYNRALELLGVSADSCVKVGNELEKDLWQAKRMGMITVLFSSPEIEGGIDAEVAEALRRHISPDELRCDFVVEGTSELRNLFKLGVS